MPENHYEPPKVEIVSDPLPRASRILKIRIVGIIVSAVAFNLSLVFGTLEGGNEGFLLGIICLLFGWGIHLSWYANPFIFLAAFFLMLDKPRGAFLASVVSLLLALTAFTILEILRDESGQMEPVTGYGIGLFLWLGCIATLLATSLICLANAGRTAERHAIDQL